MSYALPRGLHKNKQVLHLLALSLLGCLGLGAPQRQATLCMQYQYPLRYLADSNAYTIGLPTEPVIDILADSSCKISLVFPVLS